MGVQADSLGGGPRPASILCVTRQVVHLSGPQFPHWGVIPPPPPAAACYTAPFRQVMLVQVTPVQVMLFQVTHAQVTRTQPETRQVECSAKCRWRPPCPLPAVPPQAPPAHAAPGAHSAPTGAPPVLDKHEYRSYQVPLQEDQTPHPQAQGRGLRFQQAHTCIFGQLLTVRTLWAHGVLVTASRGGAIQPLCTEEGAEAPAVAPGLGWAPSGCAAKPTMMWGLASSRASPAPGLLPCLSVWPWERGSSPPGLLPLSGPPLLQQAPRVQDSCAGPPAPDSAPSLRSLLSVSPPTPKTSTTAVEGAGLLPPSIRSVLSAGPLCELASRQLRRSRVSLHPLWGSLW